MFLKSHLNVGNRGRVVGGSAAAGSDAPLPPHCLLLLRYRPVLQRKLDTSLNGMG